MLGIGPSMHRRTNHRLAGAKADSGTTVYQFIDPLLFVLDPYPSFADFLLSIIIIIIRNSIIIRDKLVRDLLVLLFIALGLLGLLLARGHCPGRSLIC